jgi:murein DD-endopeptidase MepM/ murein hydrolase activator NlpD
MHRTSSLFAGIVGLVLIAAIILYPARPADTSSLLPDVSAVDLPAPTPASVSVPDPLNVVEGVISHRTLYEALTACDIAPAEVLSLSRSFKPVFDFRCSRPDDTYRVSLDEKHSIRKFVYITSPLDEYEAVKTETGGYSVHKREIALDRKTVSRVFTIESSLSQAVSDSGEDQQITDLIADIFAWDIDFYLYPRKGDRIAVVYERCSKDGQFVKYGKIIAARYEGQQKSFSAYLFSDGTFDGYYDENGKPLKKMFLRTPVKFGKMTSNFSVRRFHPVSKRYKAHTGIDYGAPTGTPIFATANGQVAFAGWRSGYGKLIILRHPNGYQTYYGHCSRLLKTPGQIVEQGQEIARVGRTGVATGPHVHYEVRIQGKPVNPNTIKKSPATPLSPTMMASFKETVAPQILRVDDLLKEKTDLVMLTREH